MATTANGVPYAAQGEDMGDYPITSQALADMLDPAYAAVVFNGAWLDFGGPYEEVSYAKVGSVVHLRGMCKHATAGQIGTVFTFPLGYRPTKQRHYKLDAGPGWATVTISALGVVSIASYQSGGTAANLSFDGVSFDLGA